MSPVPSRRSQLQDLKAVFSNQPQLTDLHLPKICQPKQVQVVTPSHAGLWLDKYVTCFQGKNESLGRSEIDPLQHIIKDATSIAMPPVYQDFYARWRATLHGLGAICKLAHAQGRIAIGIGNESVQDTAISLHRTYGVPYLPGSALKGLAAGFAAKRLGPEWKRGSKAYLTLFGDTDQAGYITFFDAYPEPPKSEEDQLLHPDIMAIHHFNYYQGQENAAPADWDDPTLVPFPTATGSYLVALAAPDAPDWVETAFQILGMALEEMGIGAKTSSGYGRMQFESAGRPSTQAESTGENYALTKKRLLAEKPEAGRQRGVVTKVFQRSEGGAYGFITPAGGGGDIHVYESQLTPPGALREQQVVEFTLPAQTGGNKRPSAKAVVVLRQPEL